jgi:hypothetical protein
MNKMIKSIVILIFLLQLSIHVEGVEYLKKVTVLPVNNDTIKLEIVASFNMGSIDDCPDMVGIDTSRIGDSLYLKVYYDISGVWAANFCQSIDTVDVGVLPVSLKMIKVEMYTVMI